MAKYEVALLTEASFNVPVEASTREEAIQVAFDLVEARLRSVPGLCDWQLETYPLDEDDDNLDGVQLIAA